MESQNINFGVNADIRNFQNSMNTVLSTLQNVQRETEKGARAVLGDAQKVEDGVTKAANTFQSKLANFAGPLVGAFAVDSFIDRAKSVRGSFQQLEAAFSTLLQSEEKGQKMMEQMTRTAATTPFDLQGVADGAKMLLSYGTEAEDVNGTLIKLGDICAGLKIPLGDMIYLYGTTKAQGRLYMQDFNQFTNRGIPMADELVKIFNESEESLKAIGRTTKVTKADIRDLVTEGKVGFPEVEKVLNNLTKEGGKFAGLMSAQSATIAGRQSNIEDSIDQMFNEIGKNMEPFIARQQEITATLVENYTEVARVIGETASAFGILKAASMTNTAISKKMVSMQDEEWNGVIKNLNSAAGKDNGDALSSELKGYVKQGQLTEARALEIQALQKEAAERVKNLKTKADEEEQNLQTAISERTLAQERLKRANEQVESAKKEYEARMSNSSAMDASMAKIQMENAMKEQATAQSKALQAEQAVETAQIQKETAAKAANTAAQQLSNATMGKSISRFNAFKATLRANTVEWLKNTAAQLANPAVIIGAAIAGLVIGLGRLATYLHKCSEQQEAFNKAGLEAVKTAELNSESQEQLSNALESASENMIKEEIKARDLFDALKLAEKGTEEYNKAKEAIQKEYGSFLENQSKEIQNLEDVAGAYAIVTREIEKKAKAEAKASFLADVNASYSKNLAEAQKEMNDLLVPDEGFKGKTTKVRKKVLDSEGNAKLNADGSEMYEEQEVDLANFVKRQLKQTNFTEAVREEQRKMYSEAVAEANKSAQEAAKALGDVNWESAKADVSEIKMPSVFEIDTKAIASKLIDESGIIKAMNDAGMNDVLTLNTTTMDVIKQYREMVEIELERLQATELADDAFGTETELKPSGKTEEQKKKEEETKSETAKQKKEREKQEKARKTAEDKANAELQKLLNANADAEIALIESNSERKRAAREREYQKEREQLEEQKKLFVEQNKAAGTKGLSDNGLTADQNKAIDKSAELSAKQYAQDLKAIDDETLQEKLEYTKQYGNIFEKLAAVEEEYALKRKQMATEMGKDNFEAYGMDEKIDKEMKSAISKLQSEQFKATINFDVVFGNLENQSSKAIRDTMGKVQAYFDANKANMDTDEIKDYTEALTSMEEELASRNPFEAMHMSLEQIRESKEELPALMQEQQEALAQLTEAQEVYNAALAREQEIKANGGTTEEQQMATDTRVAAQNNLANAQNKVTSSTQRLQNANNKAATGYAKFQSAMGAANQKLQSMGDDAEVIAGVFSEDLAGSISEVFDTIDTVVGSADTIMGAVKEMGVGTIGAIESTVDAAALGTQAASMTAATAIRTVETASVILAIISAAIQAAMAIAKLFGNKDEDIVARIEGIDEEIDNLQRKIDDLAFDNFLETAGGIEGICKNVQQICNDTERAMRAELMSVGNNVGYAVVQAKKGMVDENKTLASYQDGISKIVESYADIDYAARKAAESGVQSAGDRAKIYAAQMARLNEQIELEKSRKAKKRDDDAIKEWEEEIAALGNQIQVEIEEEFEGLLGTDSVQFAEDLANAYLEAFQAGEDGAAAMSQSIDELMYNMLYSVMVLKPMKDAMNNIFETLKEDLYDEEGNLTKDQAVYEEAIAKAGASMRELGDVMSTNMEALNDVAEEAGIDVDSLSSAAADRTADAQGIATASQESVDLNNARLTTIQGHTYQLVNGVAELNKNATLGVAYAQQIATNTANTTMRILQLGATMSQLTAESRYIRSTLADIQTNGLKAL